jgi:predicted nucleic acid-binding protein
MSVLVDTSIWIDYFRNKKGSHTLDPLIEDGLIVTNALILAELTPYLYVQNQRRLIALLENLKTYSISINWDHLVEMQVLCIRNGINGVGIPDLIIAQNAIQCRIKLFSADKHFALMAQSIPLDLYQI